MGLVEWLRARLDADEQVPRGDYCSTVRLLALPFADAPGYRDEWRPE